MTDSVDFFDWVRTVKDESNKWIGHFRQNQIVLLGKDPDVETEKTIKQLESDLKWSSELLAQHGMN